MDLTNASPYCDCFSASQFLGMVFTELTLVYVCRFQNQCVLQTVEHEDDITSCYHKHFAAEITVQ